MHSTPGPKQTDSHDVLVARVDEEFANPRRQLARDQEQVSKPERDTARYPSDPQIPVNRFRPAVLRGSVDDRPVGAAVRTNFVTASGKNEASRAAEPTWFSSGLGGASTFGNSIPVQDHIAGRRADRRSGASRAGTFAPEDNARSCKRGAGHRAAQDQPGTDG